MASATINYRAVIVLPEEELLDLLHLVTVLDEIGAQSQAEQIQKITQQFQRVR